MAENPSETTVLVTGASGFIASHCIVQLLQQGYRVRGTLRTPSRADEIRKAIAAEVDPGDRLEFCTADLDSDAGWADAVRAAPTSSTSPRPFPRPRPGTRTNSSSPPVTAPFVYSAPPPKPASAAS
jgi:NAD(P)-dependent dehydrogenase (short-subunit alcohol dehydrogenase family)